MHLKSYSGVGIFFFFFFFETRFLYVALTGCPRTHYVDQDDLKHPEICLPIPPECYIYRRLPPHLARAGPWLPFSQLWMLNVRERPRGPGY